MSIHTISPQLARAMQAQRQNDRDGDQIRREAGQKQALSAYQIEKLSQINAQQMQQIALVISSVQSIAGQLGKMQDTYNKATKTPPINAEIKSFSNKVTDAVVDATEKMAGLAQKSAQKAGNLRGQAVSLRAQAASGTASQTDQQMSSLMQAFTVEA